MKVNGYTNSEINILKQNPNVVMIKYGRQIEYKDSFKKWAVIQSLTHPELSAIQIFESAGFCRNIIGSRTADSRLRYWKGNYFKSKTIIYCPNKKIDKENIDKQNNEILILLLSRFEHLINVLVKKDAR